MTSIVDFYAGRTVFVTGATGFMGKVLLEKLLRSCPAITKIYVLIRPKKGLSVEMRLTQLLESKLFDTLRSEDVHFQSKVVPVVGDILDPGLGLAESDVQQLSAEVSIVFHSAATVKFDEPLKFSVNMNVIGVSRMVELCRKLDRLEALIHISTAYANCDRRCIQEVVYPPPLSPAKVISAVEWMNDEVIEMLTQSMIAPRPNTYTYTKAIAESLLLQLCTDARVPCAIVRPSIVGAAWQQPVAGWVDNFNGPSGLFAAIGKGLLRVMMGDVEAGADIIPVDMAVSLIIAAAWSTAIERPSSIPVFNCTTGQINQLTWGQVERACHECYTKYPMESPVRLPEPKFTTNRMYFELHRLFDHFLPAWMMDLCLSAVGKKPVLWRMQTRLWRSVGSLQYFTSNQWSFETTNVVNLLSRMCAEDRQVFDFDVARIHWPTYLENYCLGVKRYALGEDVSRLPLARQAISRLVLRRRVKYAVAAILLWLMVRYFRGQRNTRHALLSLIARIYPSSAHQLHAY